MTVERSDDVQVELSRDEINRLPLRRFPGPIHILRSADRVPDAVSEISKHSVLGFDTETRPAFKKGSSYTPSLIQLATADSVFLFQIGVMGFPGELARVLANPSIYKVGVGLDFDLRQLTALRDFEPAGFVDIAPLASRAGLKKVSLRTLAATFLGFRISKGAKCSNWSVRHLRKAQVSYAATDAWASREVYLAILEENPSLDDGSRYGLVGHGVR